VLAGGVEGQLAGAVCGGGLREDMVGLVFFVLLNSYQIPLLRA